MIFILLVVHLELTKSHVICNYDFFPNILQESSVLVRFIAI